MNGSVDGVATAARTKDPKNTPLRHFLSWCPRTTLNRLRATTITGRKDTPKMRITFSSRLEIRHVLKVLDLEVLRSETCHHHDAFGPDPAHGAARQEQRDSSAHEVQHVLLLLGEQAGGHEGPDLVDTGMVMIRPQTINTATTKVKGPLTSWLMSSSSA